MPIQKLPNHISMREVFKKALWQVVLIILMAAITGMIFNNMREIPLPVSISGAKSYKFISKTIRKIPVEQAFSFLLSGDAIFIDARSHEEYKRGHIKGAINIPYQNIDKYYDIILKELPPQKLIIIYCGSEGCNISLMLARELIQMGFEQVGVLDGGWKRWKSRGLYVNKFK